MEAEQPASVSQSGGQGSAPDALATLAHLLEDTSDQDSLLFRAMNAGYKRRIDLLASIFAKCKQEGDCLIWQGPHSGSGRGGDYGRFSFEGSTASVHRTVYACVYGPIPPKKQIDHECNNRRCCNPFHLKRMTHKQNQKLRDLRRSGPTRET